MSTDTIDIRDFPQKGYALKLAIEQAVADTQRVIIQPLPNKIIMTRAQYDMLQHDPEMIGMYKSNEYLWKTHSNVMEIVIK